MTTTEVPVSPTSTVIPDVVNHAGVEHTGRFFEVKLDLFDGPLDLLLHLVKNRELPIEKLSLAVVTDQYLECIKRMRYYDVDVAAEYLVIAATLLAIKAGALLNESVEVPAMEEISGEDLHEELLRRLRELELFRAAAGSLQHRPMLGHDVFGSPERGVKIDSRLVPLANHEANILMVAFQNVLRRAGERSVVLSITADPVSTVERMRTVVDRLQQTQGRSTFTQLLSDATDRFSAIGIFVALLELCRRRIITVAQIGHGEEISIALAELGEPIVQDRDEHAEPVTHAAA